MMKTDIAKLLSILGGNQACHNGGDYAYCEVGNRNNCVMIEILGSGRRKVFKICVSNDSEFSEWCEKHLSNARDTVDAIYEVIGL